MPLTTFSVYELLTKDNSCRFVCIEKIRKYFSNIYIICVGTTNIPNYDAQGRRNWVIH